MLCLNCCSPEVELILLVGSALSAQSIFVGGKLFSSPCLLVIVVVVPPVLIVVGSPIKS